MHLRTCYIIVTVCLWEVGGVMRDPARAQVEHARARGDVLLVVVGQAAHWLVRVASVVSVVRVCVW